MKKLFSTIVFVLILLSLAPLHQTLAANWVDEDYAKGLFEALTNSAVNSPAYASHMNTNYMLDLVRKILGPVLGLTITDDMIRRNPEYVQQLAQGSAIAGIGNYIAMIYANPPATTAIALQDFGQSLGFIPKKTYAQGVGFTGFTAILPLWRVFRNIAYVLLAIVLLAVGFMVMFRKKIDPKTVVTVQNALPRIVVTLLLITFSYAIVGILIDLMYLLIALVLSIIQSQGLITEVRGVPKLWVSSQGQAFTTGGLFTYFYTLFPWGLGSMLNAVAQVFGLAGVGIPGLIAGISGAFIGFSLGGPFGAAIGTLTGFTAFPVLVTLILSLVILFLFLRLFFLVLTSYIQIVLALVIGPVQLVFDAIPGVNSFSSWIRNLIANIAVFPTIGIMGMISLAFATQADKVGALGNDLWTPPYGLMGANVQSISALFSLGILITIPSIVNSVKEALKAKPAVPIVGAFGQVISTPAATGLQLLSAAYYLRGMIPETFWKRAGVATEGPGSTSKSSP